MYWPLAKRGMMKSGVIISILKGGTRGLKLKEKPKRKRLQRFYILLFWSQKNNQKMMIKELSHK